MDLIAWIILTGLFGIALGFLLGRSTGSGREASQLRNELAERDAALSAKTEELDNYRLEVFEQFGETAQKFKTLNDSYADLHQQLARSASILCGEVAADTLLEAPGQPALDTQASPAEEATGAADAGSEAAADTEVTTPATSADTEANAGDAVPTGSDTTAEVPTLDISQAVAGESDADTDDNVEADPGARKQPQISVEDLTDATSAVEPDNSDEAPIRRTG